MESCDLMLTGAQVVLYGSEGLQTAAVDIAVQNGCITHIGANLKIPAQETIDLRGLHLLPGVIDSQVHFREPGLTHKEDLESGTRGALLGGVTSIFEMPNTQPPTTTRELLEEKLQKAKGRCHTHYAFYVGASPDNADSLKELEQHPHCSGVKLFMGSSTGSLLVEEDLHIERVLRSGRRRVIVHAEDESRLRSRRHLAEEGAHPRFHPIWRDEETAYLATQRLLRLARLTGRPVHVLHVSSAREMDLLKTQKDIATVEVLPQHLTLSAPECYERWGTFAQMNPPIRDQLHQDRLWKAILDGTVDIIGSDHAPHTREEKAKPYPQSPSGFPGVQTLVTLMLNHVHQRRLSLEKFVELVTENPRRVFGIKNKGRIAVGFDADFTIIDLKKTRRIENSWIASRVGWTPFDGMQTTGWPVMTILRGQLVMREDQILTAPQGRAVDFEGTMSTTG